MDRERLPSGGTTTQGSRPRLVRVLTRTMVGVALVTGSLLAGSPAALADGVVIGVSVSERPEAPTSSGPGTEIDPSGTSDGLVPTGTGTSTSSPGAGSSGAGSSGAQSPDGQQPASGSEDDLASTGLSTFWLITPAALLVGAGALAVAVARRRRTTGAHAA